MKTQDFLFCVQKINPRKYLHKKLPLFQKFNLQLLIPLRKTQIPVEVTVKVTVTVEVKMTYFIHLPTMTRF